jgi:death-on-curing protein
VRSLLSTDDIRYIQADTALEINRLLGHEGMLRDANLLESALAAPKNAAYYEHADIVEQTAILIERVALNHPFVDGNKRTAFILGSTFLLINGWEILYTDDSEEIEYAKQIEQLVSKKDFKGVIAWIRAHISTLE